uniref:Ras modification protein ERF4 n=1 Tax=Kwoniella dejecticola CBS 10117 TaxID=1296121 RepID=A0A1A5ZY03_9TREE|nr:uncharacterized protein I303_07455 [Kwoniella dejecticola CBS 10117]OBR82691.1 hypothetical protein I303_07455 [Kwoniella dejecticola CBS 10117]
MSQPSSTPMTSHPLLFTSSSPSQANPTGGHTHANTNTNANANTGYDVNTPGNSESSPFVRVANGNRRGLANGTTQASDTLIPRSEPVNGLGSGAEGSFSVIRSPGASATSNSNAGGVQGQEQGPGQAKYQDWEEEYERSKLKEWEEKVEKDLQGWRGGHGKPRSYYALQALPPQSYFHQPISGTIGRHLPKEIIRIDRDWSGGELCQFDTVYPLELDGRIRPSELLSFINTLNEIMYSAYSVKGAIWDNLVAVGTLWTSLIWRTSHFERELVRAEEYIQKSNKEIFNEKGLNVLSPRYVALQFLEIE